MVEAGFVVCGGFGAWLAGAVTAMTTLASPISSLPRRCTIPTLPISQRSCSNEPISRNLMSAIGSDQPTFGAGSISISGLPDTYKTVAIPFYAYDSYDISALLGSDGKRINTAGGTPGFQIDFSTDWSAAKFPALIALPKECEGKRRTNRPFCGWKICEPKI